MDWEKVAEYDGDINIAVLKDAVFPMWEDPQDGSAKHEILHYKCHNRVFVMVVKNLETNELSFAMTDTSAINGVLYAKKITDPREFRVMPLTAGFFNTAEEMPNVDKNLANWLKCCDNY